MKTKKKLEKVVSLTEETPEQTKKRPKSIKQKHKEVPWSEQIQLRRTPKAKSTELKKPEEVQLRLLKKVPVEVVTEEVQQTTVIDKSKATTRTTKKRTGDKEETTQIVMVELPEQITQTTIIDHGAH